MHVLVVRIHLGGVLLATCSEIPNVIKVKLISAVCEAPHSDIELSVFEQKRFLDVLLDNPVRELEAGLQKPNNLAQLIQNLDALALVLIGWLDQPNILLTVLLR